MPDTSRDVPAVTRLPALAGVSSSEMGVYVTHSGTQKHGYCTVMPDGSTYQQDLHEGAQLPSRPHREGLAS